MYFRKLYVGITSTKGVVGYRKYECLFLIKTGPIKMGVTGSGPRGHVWESS